MLGAVHACIGAGAGSFTESKLLAFGAGMASHTIADALPHHDLAPELEVPLLLATLAGIAYWKGLDSTEFWGAVGGVAPDLEHGLVVTGLLDADKEIFPSHAQGGKWHGDESRTERWSQALLAAACLAMVVLNDD